MSTASLGGGPYDVAVLQQQGTFHRLFLLTTNSAPPRILKVNIAPELGMDSGMRIEQAVTRVARLRSIPCVDVIRVDLSRSICEFDYLVSEHAPGAALSVYDSDEGKINALLSALAAQLTALHAITVDGFGLLGVSLEAQPDPEEPEKLRGLFSGWHEYLTTRLEDHVVDCDRFGALGAFDAEKVVDLFGTRSFQTPVRKASLLHGDPGSHNAFTDGHAITALIDWEDALAGDPLYDIAMLATFHPERRFASIYRGALGYDVLPDEDAFRFWIYFLRIALAKTVHRRRFGYSDLPGRRPARDRIVLALQRLSELA